MSDIPIYGIDKELQDKANAKYDINRENAAREWIESISGEKLGPDFADSLKNGVILCKLLNKIKPKIIPNWSEGNNIMAFKQMENINHFLTGCETLGVRKTDLFQTVDLYEKKNIGQVVDAIYSLSSVVSKDGQIPRLGPKLAESRTVPLTEEQIQASKTIIPKQSTGSHGGATASGVVYGGIRNIDQKAGVGSNEPSKQTQGSHGGATATGINYGQTRQVVPESKK